MTDIMTRLDSILDRVIIHHLANGNKHKAQEYLIYKKNLRLLSIIGIENLIKELEADAKEIFKDAPEQVVFT